MYGEGNFCFGFDKQPEVNCSQPPEFPFSEKDYSFHCDLPLTDAVEDSSRPAGQDCRSSFKVRLNPESTELEWLSRPNMFRSARRPKAHHLNVDILLPVAHGTPKEKPTSDESIESTPTLTYHWVPVKKVPAPKHWEAISFTFADKIHEQFAEKYDRVSGVYEGGLKLWDCAVDISAFFLDQCKRHEGDISREIRGLLVSYIQTGHVRFLDLGCGQGLCSLAASHGLRHLCDETKAHESCDFQFLLQDYDSDVLKKATIPNFELNADAQSTPFPMGHFSFIATSWRLFTELLKKQIGANSADIKSLKLFDPSHIIMGSDVLFSPESCAEVAWLIIINAISFYHTQPTDGLSPLALIGSKKHYFGTNGSVQLFVRLIHEYSKSAHSLGIPHTLKKKITGLCPITETYWSNAEKDRVIVGVTFRIEK